MDADAHGEPSPQTVGLRVPHGLDDGETGPHGGLRVALVGDRVPEERENAVAEVLVDHAAKGFDLSGAELLVRVHELAQLFGVEAVARARSNRPGRRT